LDLKIGGVIQIFHTPLLDASASVERASLVASIPGDETQIVLPPLSGTYYVGAVDSSGNPSPNYARIVFDGATVFDRNVVVELEESPLVPGLKQNTIVDQALNALKIDNRTIGTATYEFSQIVDMRGSLVARIAVELIAVSVNELEAFDDAPGLFDSREGLFDGSAATQSSGIVQFQFSDDGTTYTDWLLASGEQRKFRYCKMRLLLSTSNPAYNVYCYRLKVAFDVDDLIQEGRATSATTGDTPVTFGRAFFATPLIVGNIENATSGDHFSISNPTSDGFDLSIYNGSGNRIQKNFVFIAKGY
jgi:hypothetical protein